MQDPMSFNVPTAGVDTQLPKLPENDYVLQCVESKAAPNKDRNGLNWELKFATTEPVVATDGRNIAPNFPVFHIAALQAKEDSKDPQAYLRNLGDIQDALFGTDKSNRLDVTPELVASAVGRKVIGHVYLDEWPVGSGSLNNKIKRLKKFQG